VILSICIPSYNRVEHLNNCLNSILIAKNNFPSFDFEVCVSDNNSEQDVKKIIQNYSDKFNLKFNQNKKNLGFANNAIKSVSMAEGKYSWLIGNDDLVTPDSFFCLNSILKNNLDKDYFYINSYCMNSKYLENFPKPFDTKNIVFENLDSISKIKKDMSVNFWDVIDKEVSWDFLIGIFLSIFKTEKWLQQVPKLDKKKIDDTGVWSTFENTCLNPILIAESCKNSKAFVCSKPLSVNLFGEREWGDMYEFIEIVRIPELIDFYRSRGLSFKKYIYCKNYSLRNFSNYFYKIYTGPDKKGKHLVDFKRHFLTNLIYPNAYFSIVTSLINKLVKFIGLK